MKLNEIKEAGFYREENDSDRKIIFEIYENGDKEWLEKDPNATWLLDTWIYQYKDENDRNIYFTNGDVSAVYLAVYLDETSIDVIKIEDTNYKVFGEYGHLLVEDKPTYKEQLKNFEARVKELEEKLKIAEKALQYYVNSKMPDNLYTSERITNSAIWTDNLVICGEFNQCKYKVYYDNETAQQALQNIKED